MDFPASTNILDYCDILQVIILFYDWHLLTVTHKFARSTVPFGSKVLAISKIFRSQSADSGSSERFSAQVPKWPRAGPWANFRQKTSTKKLWAKYWHPFAAPSRHDALLSSKNVLKKTFAIFTQWLYYPGYAADGLPGLLHISFAWWQYYRNIREIARRAQGFLARFGHSCFAWL